MCLCVSMFVASICTSFLLRSIIYDEITEFNEFLQDPFLLVPKYDFPTH